MQGAYAQIGRWLLEDLIVVVGRKDCDSSVHTYVYSYVL